MEDKLETCKNCAWWWVNTLGPVNDETRAGDLTSFWECTNPALDLAYGEEGSLSGVQCNERISPGPDFGCIHWQVKEPF